MRQESAGSRTPQFRRSSIGTAIALAFMVGMPSAFAFEFKSESGEVTGSFDTTLSAGALWRMDKRDSSLISIANGGTSRDPNSDDGNLKYDNGELVSTVFKATHDLEVKYQNFGAFLRASYFYDPTIHSKNSLSSKAVDELGSNAEILDAYVYGSFDLGGRKLNLRLGKQVVSWGESTFIQNGINVLNPVNVSRLRAPGSEVKEGLIPMLMGYGSLEITDGISVELALPAEWKETKIDPAGSFFSSNDFATEGGNIAYVGFGRRNDANGAAIPFNLSAAAPGWAPRSKDREASDGGQYGVALRFFLPELNNTELGFFHANYHSRTPFVSGYRGGLSIVPPTVIPGCTAFDVPRGLGAGCAFAAGRAGTYFIEYPEDIKLYGMSFNTSLPGGVALQGEYSYRRNQPLQLPSADLLLAAVGLANQLTSLNPVAARDVPYGTEISGYRRVKMHQMQVHRHQGFRPDLRRRATGDGRRGGLYPARSAIQPQVRRAGLPPAAARIVNSHFFRIQLDQLLRDREFVGLSPRRPAGLSERHRRGDGFAAHRLLA